MWYIRVERKYCREEITMNTEAYILTKLSNLSEEDELLAQEIEKDWVHGQLH